MLAADDADHADWIFGLRIPRSSAVNRIDTQFRTLVECGRSKTESTHDRSGATHCDGMWVGMIDRPLITPILPSHK